MELNEQASFTERRTGVRHITVFRLGRLANNRQDQLCVMRNISAGGAMVEINHPPEVGARVLLDLRSDRRFTATVRWQRERSVGFQFDVPIDVEAVLRDERPSIRRDQPRAFYFQREGEARVMGGETATGTVIEIAVNSLQIRALTVGFATEEPVVVAIDGLGATRATVLGTDAQGVTSLRLNAPFSYKALADWLDSRAGPA